MHLLLTQNIMLKKLLAITLLCPSILFGQGINNRSQDNDIIENFIRLSAQQLADTARYYSKKSSYDTALICYNLAINTIPKNANIEQQTNLCKYYNQLAIIHGNAADYRMSYNYFIKALHISEKYNLVHNESIVYMNIGVIYTRLYQYDIAKQYYLKALELCIDSTRYPVILNNLGDNEIKRGELDSAYYYISKSISISKQFNDTHFAEITNTLASYYQKIKQYDSAFYYFQLSLEHSKATNQKRAVAINLSDIGNLFFELNKTDSAQYYIAKSNIITRENRYLSTLLSNYLTLSEIEKSKGKFENALNLYMTYHSLKDSILNSDVYASINLLQRQHEISKTNQQIEELEIDRKVKESKIHFQKIIQRIIIIALLLLIIVLFIIVSQHKKLSKAYDGLVDKNIEIIELQKYAEIRRQGIEDGVAVTEVTLRSKAGGDDAETSSAKKVVLSEKLQKELLSRILAVMENTSIICNPAFTLEELTDLIQSNQFYVSHIINNVLKKNFRAFLNGYRIREAQRLFSEADTQKYTVEFIANKVGFMSRQSFYEAFKEITNVTPAFYVKALHRKQKD